MGTRRCRAVLAVVATAVVTSLAGPGLGAAQAAPAYTCDASAARVTLLAGLTVEPATANENNPVCADDSAGLPAVQIPNAMLPVLSASAITARTEILCSSDDPDPDEPPVPGSPETQNDTCDATPPITQQVVSSAGATDIVIGLGGFVIQAEAVESTSRAYCDEATNRPAFTSESKVVKLTVNGTVIELPPNGDEFILDLGIIRLALNERIGTEGVQPAGPTSGGLTRRALHASVPSDGAIADVVVGESAVGYNEDVCPEARVVIKKETAPDEAANSTSFGFTSTGGLTPGTFSLSDDGVQTFSEVQPGQFTVTEDAPIGPYSLANIECSDPTGNTTMSVQDRRASIDVAGGETVTCTFTNERAPRGTIVIRKQTSPDEDPNATSFGFSSTGGLTPGTFSLQDDGEQTFTDLEPGQFSITEDAPTGGYDLESIDCIDATGNSTTDLATRTANIDVAGNETVTCTFTNQQEAKGTVIIRKETEPDEDPAATDFAFTSTGGLTPDAFTLRDDGQRVFNNVEPGSYTVTETAPAAPYSLDRIECVDATTNSAVSVPDRRANIEVAAGETVICTFTNEKALKGTIVVKKQTTPEENPNSTTFGFTTTGLTPAAFNLQDDGTQTFSELEPGEYSVTENAPATPYTLTVIDCADASGNTTTDVAARTASINVAAGETVSCTFVNFRPGPGTVVCPEGSTPDANGNCIVTSTGCPPGTAKNPQGQCISTSVRCPEGTILLPGSLTCEAGPAGGTIGVLGDLRSSVCRDRVVGAQFAILGTGGADRITGTNLDDRIFPFGGNDRVSGGRGNDCIEGAAGRDILDGSNGQDVLLGGSGNDRLSGGPDNDRLDGGSGNDRISGSNGNDRLIGGSGKDLLRGEDGNDRLLGGSGNDSIHTGNGRDIVDGGSGNDIINAATVGPRVRVNCGSGRRDRVRINTNEIRRTRNCEFIYILRRVDRRR